MSMRTGLTAVAVLLLCQGGPALAQVGQFQGVADASTLIERIRGAEAAVAALDQGRTGCDPTRWREARELYTDALASITGYANAMIGPRLLGQVASLAIHHGDAALASGCSDEARGAFLKVVEDFPGPRDAHLRERARIGLDDVRHRQLLDAMSRR